MPPEIQQDFTLLAVFGVVRAFAWLASALAAAAAYRSYRQLSDVGWLVVFLIMAAVSAGHASVASSWGSLGMTEVLPPKMEYDLYMSLRLAAFELVAAVLAFFVFRRPRISF
jgi:hypothetical protein